MKFLKSFILISTCLLLSSCYFFDNAEDNYIQVKEVVNNVETSNTFYLFENYDSMKEIIVNLVNENFKKWHWNQNKFEEKYDKYKGNITLHQKSNIRDINIVFTKEVLKKLSFLLIPNHIDLTVQF